MMRPTRVVIVDDSPTQRLAMTRLIGAAGDMIVVGEASDGIEAFTMVERLRPDVISMDVKMPRLDGLGATRRIMDACPTPIVVVSSVAKSALAMDLLNAGALAAVEKPPAPGDLGYQERCDEIVKMLRLMAGVRVIRHWNPENPPRGTAQLILPTSPGVLSSDSPEAVAPSPVIFHAANVPAIVGIGASAGGPGALAAVLGGLPADFPLPIVIVQHLSAEFVPGLAEWLDRACAITVCLAVDGETPQPGVAYMAPGNAHLRLSADKRLMLDYNEDGAYRHRPAVDALFESLAAAYGARSIGVVLTGMGDDGAAGLQKVRLGGARTIAQNAETCVVFGMPAAAIERGAAEYVLPLTAIGRALLILAGRGGTRSLVGTAQRDSANMPGGDNSFDNTFPIRAPKPTGGGVRGK